MNEKIIGIVRRTPGIKTGQVADQLDVDFSEAERLCNALVLANRLTGEMVPLTGGGKVMAYHVLGQLHEQPTRFITPPKAFEQPVVPRFLPNGVKNPDASQPPVTEQSKVDRAISHLRAHHCATSEQLGKAMGISKGYVANYIAGPRKRGEIVRDGDLWKLGAGRPARPAPVREEKPEATAVVKPVLPLVPPLAKPVEAPPEGYRCGLWSDGTIELQENGMEVARLTELELDFINGFMAKQRVG